MPTTEAVINVIVPGGRFEMTTGYKVMTDSGATSPAAYTAKLSSSTSPRKARCSSSDILPQYPSGRNQRYSLVSPSTGHMITYPEPKDSRDTS